MTLIAFYKPYGVVSQFTALADHPTLAQFGLPKGVYPCGRLDVDSEGLLLLTDDGMLQRRLSDPRFQRQKTYWAQVEGIPSAENLARLCAGLRLKDGMTRPCAARLLKEEPALPPRNPPIRYRKNIPTSWIELILTEGKNRQARRMTAAIGHPTLRLVRARVGREILSGLEPGRWKRISGRA